MATKAIGGGSGAVASSSHAACPRFRGTDPLIVGRTRRNLAKDIGFPDAAGGIPQARWQRAMTFERLVRNDDFAPRIVTRTVGALDLDRPGEVLLASAHVNVDTTARLLTEAHTNAISHGRATLIHQLAIPFVGFEDERATDVKPDFAVVAPMIAAQGGGSWLIMGDAKDYERLRSRIEDSRMLKGFLQVAVGAESAAAWSRLPTGMSVHSWGVLAVPRNSFLQPNAEVENLHDHREEVRLRIQERVDEARETPFDDATPIAEHVSHLQAVFDPSACMTCTLFSFCRHELRQSSDPADLLVELGVPRDSRKLALGLVDPAHPVGRVPASLEANIWASVTGIAQPTGQLRVDQIGVPGTINVVIAKSDAAALGIHGVAIQRIAADGPGEWLVTVFKDPQSPETRRKVMRALGKQINLAMRDQRRAAPDGETPDAVHLVVPDHTSADVLVSIADNLAGVELSRLRWQRDKDMGRAALTWDGEPANVPIAITEQERTAISLLLETDRARAYSLRSAVIDARGVLARHVVAGGPAMNSGRLDYLVGWAESGAGSHIDHRAFGDAIEKSDHTPGARLTNATSDAIHEALVGEDGRRPADGAADSAAYEQLVSEELGYKAAILTRAIAALDGLTDSKLRPAYRKIESDAQEVWRRRLSLHASDLVRFGRTYRNWRNGQVREIESDGKCSTQLLVLSNPQAAHDMATSAGTREVAFATIVSASPLILDVDSRRIVSGSRIVLLTVNEQPCAEEPIVTLGYTGSAFKLTGLSIGPLSRGLVPADSPKSHLYWAAQLPPVLNDGDRLVIADFAWFSKAKRNTALNIDKPAVDTQSAPKPDCDAGSYDADPNSHQWCCRSHEDREAQYSDEIASQRARGELNPEVWPPVRDHDAFDVPPAGAPSGNPYAEPTAPGRELLTIDDLD